MTGSDYATACHARAQGGDPDVVWVVVARWSELADGSSDWYLEQWDAQGEAGEDIPATSEDAAKAIAHERFGVPVNSWQPGPQPFSR